MSEIITEMEELALSFDRMAWLECNTAEETVRYSAVSKRLNECINILSVMVKKELLNE